MTIRDELIIRIVEDRLIDGGVITNYQIMGISFMCGILRDKTINALPGSIMRNWTEIAREYRNKYVMKRNSNRKLPYHFDHASRTDYHLSKGFVKWLGGEYKKLRRGDEKNISSL